jgi:CheY-like chemotaxis protein
MQGRIGLELAREHHPHLILLDLHLPDITGRDVLREIREDPKLCEIPVVVISADATAREIAKLRASGARDYVTKPFEVSRLVMAVSDALNDREVA